MSLLSHTVGPGGLLDHYWVDWIVTRTTTTGKDPVTGAPVTDTAPLADPVAAHFSWATQRDQVDYQADTDAILLTQPGALQAGDRIANATYGSFLVSEASPKPQGPFDRVEVRRAG